MFADQYNAEQGFCHHILVGGQHLTLLPSISESSCVLRICQVDSPSGKLPTSLRQRNFNFKIDQGQYLLHLLNIHFLSSYQDYILLKMCPCMYIVIDLYLNSLSRINDVFTKMFYQRFLMDECSLTETFLIKKTPLLLPKKVYDSYFS